MGYKIVPMAARKKIALVAHDNKKLDLFDWAKFNRDLLADHVLYATGTTGSMLEQELDLSIHKLESGPLAGDQQIGAKISANEIDFVIFFWDPLESLPHDPDIKALLRIAVVWNIPVACNRASADFMFSSPLMSGIYQRLIPDYSGYRSRLEAAGQKERLSRRGNLWRGLETSLARRSCWCWKNSWGDAARSREVSASWRRWAQDSVLDFFCCNGSHVPQPV